MVNVYFRVMFGFWAQDVNSHLIHPINYRDSLYLHFYLSTSKYSPNLRRYTRLYTYSKSFGQIILQRFIQLQSAAHEWSLTTESFHGKRISILDSKTTATNFPNNQNWINTDLKVSK